MAERVLRSRLVGINVPAAERIVSAALGGALAFVGAQRRTIGGAVLAAIGAALIVRGITGRSALYRMRTVRKGIEVRRSVTVQASPGEVYELWREMRGSVDVVEDSTARRLRWRSLPHDELHFEGTLDLIEAVGDRGTIVDVRILYRPRGGLVVSGLLGSYLRKLHGIELAEELSRMRMVLETGELATGAMTSREAIAEELRP